MKTMSFSLDTLEYEKLLELVSRNAQTPMGVERFAGLRPKTNRLELNSKLFFIYSTNFVRIYWTAIFIAFLPTF